MNVAIRLALVAAGLLLAACGAAPGPSRPTTAAGGLVLSSYDDCNRQGEQLAR